MVTQSRTRQTSLHPRALLIYNDGFMLEEITHGNIIEIIIHDFVHHKYPLYTQQHIEKKLQHKDIISVNTQITIKRCISCKVFAKIKSVQKNNLIYLPL